MCGVVLDQQREGASVFKTKDQTKGRKYFRLQMLPTKDQTKGRQTDMESEEDTICFPLIYH